MPFAKKTYAEALEAAQNRPRRTKKPMSKGKGFQRGNGSGSLKRTQSSPIRAKGTKKKKKLTTGQLKKKVWTQFSIFIRTRGADENGYQSCFTCSVVKFWRGFEAGHFIPGRYNSILFEERAVWPQCRKCNGHLRGNTIVYYPKMVDLYGREAVNDMIRQKDRTHKWEPDELVNLLEKYRTLNDANPVVKCESP